MYYLTEMTTIDLTQVSMILRWKDTSTYLRLSCSYRVFQFAYTDCQCVYLVLSFQMD